MRKLAKKATGGVAKKPLVKKQMAGPVASVPSARMQQAVSDSTAGAQRAKQILDASGIKQQYKGQFPAVSSNIGSNLRSDYEKAVRATKRPGTVRVNEKIAANEQAKKAAMLAKQSKPKQPMASAAKPAVTIQRKGGAVKSKKK
jgi:hypothetical protein